MRIFQIINHAGLDRGGAERLARGLHQDLRAAGYDARLITPDSIRRMVLEASVRASDPRAVLVGRDAYLDAGRRRGSRASVSQHALCIGPAAGGAVARALRHDRAQYLEPAPRQGVGTRSGPSDLCGFGQVAAISTQTEKALLQAQPRLVGRTYVVTNGTDLRFEAVPERSPDPVCPTILSVGRLVRQKNYRAGLQALARLQERDWTYRIAGAGPDEAALRALAGSLGIGDRVQFLGHVADIGPVLKTADMFLMPSLWRVSGWRRSRR